MTTLNQLMQCTIQYCEHLQVRPAILDHLFMVTYPRHEFTAWILIIASKRKKKKNIQLRK